MRYMFKLNVKVTATNTLNPPAAFYSVHVKARDVGLGALQIVVDMNENQSIVHPHWADPLSHSHLMGRGGTEA